MSDLSSGENVYCEIQQQQRDATWRQTKAKRWTTDDTDFSEEEEEEGLLKDAKADKTTTIM